MARFTCHMPEDSFYAFTRMFDGETGRETKLKICEAGAQVLLRRLREFLTANTHDPNAKIRGRLAESLTIEPKYDTVFVQPKGKHHGRTPRAKQPGYHRPKTGQGTSGQRRHHGMSGGISAQDVGYYLEYGTPRMTPLHWMEITLEQSEEEVTAAMEAAFNKYMDEAGL